MLGFGYTTLYTCLLEWQIHAIDLLRALGGQITSLQVQHAVVAAERAAIALVVRLSTDAVALVALGTEGGPGPFCERLEITGDGGAGIIVDNARQVVTYRASTGEATIWQSDWRPVRAHQSFVLDGYVPNIQHFVDAVVNRTVPVTPSLADGVAALTALEDIASQLGISPQWSPTQSDR